MFGGTNGGRNALRAGSALLPALNSGIVMPFFVGCLTGLEPVTSGSTDRRSAD